MSVQFTPSSANFVHELYQYGHANIRNHELERALACFTMVQALEEGHLGAWVDGAYCFRELGRFKEAEDALAKVLKTQPRNPWALTSLGIIRQKQGDHSTASTYFHQAILSDDVNFSKLDAIINLAISFLAQEKYEESQELLEFCLINNPDNLLLNIKIAENSFLLNDFERAVSAARKAIQLDDGERGSILVLIQALERLGLAEEALDVLASAREKSGFDPHFVAAELTILRSSGRITEVRAFVDKLTAQGDLGLVHVWFSAALCLVSSGDLSGAEAMLSEAPNENWHQRAEAEFIRGKLAVARDEYDAALHSFQCVQAFNPHWDISVDYAQLGLLTLDLPLVAQALTAKPTDMWHRAALAHYRAVFDTYARDQVQIQQLQEITLLEPSAQIHQICRLVREYPESVPASTVLIRSMLQAGILQNFQTLDCAQEEKIPRRIFQYWENDLPDDVRSLLNIWPEMNPDHEYILYTRDKAEAFLMENFPERVIQAFRKARQSSRRANILRYAFLFINGGIYFDADERCLVPLARWLPYRASCVATRKELGVLNCNFIAIEARNPIMQMALDGAVEAIFGTSSDPLWLRNGPGRFTSAMASQLAENFGEKKFDIVILDRNEEQSFYSTDFGLSYKRTGKHWWVDEYHEKSK